ncbi:tRNA pseudouridine(13) synthase TruD [Psychrobacter frigidicola]|uniref:tRNA pseudouridine synthase D n=1 Tax=Psychrobacter frigidicola TaxID=45611 RepID=A0A5C7AA32_9GAMM|nr:tRNA pseudouridine(13) synthase TruD [Psychrobacter frigidicola]TXD98516.1 tRNA pseudouridine(13) synthase TruD [Psychrobacter frigidicola]
MPFQETNITATTAPLLKEEDTLAKKSLIKEPFDSSSLDFAALTDTSKLPQPTLAPLMQATYKTCAEDFVVNEILPNTFTDEGEHLWLHMQKVGMNTAYLAKLLSEWANIPLRDVGYSGLKDRHALTTQWFSLRIPKKQLPPTNFTPTDLGDNETVQILAQHWHNKKLGRGAHRANQFVITLRDIQFEADNLLVEQQQLVEQHLQHMNQYGVPNYFGPQRFGHGGNNVREALRLFAQPVKNINPSQKKGKRAPREQHTMALSAARSLIFNKILAMRVRDGSWNQGMAGEVFNLNGSGSIFASEQLDDTLRARLTEGDIHPTAVLWGTDNDKVAGAAAKLETDVIQKSPLLTELATGLEQRDIKAQRRALRLPIEDLSWQWSDEQTLVLRFSLPTGSFATSVLASLVQNLQISSF